ncbi:hypothetical protein DY000_02059752 [Brassica cretica]|uniref:Uncharacterized protein n=1 Tax=Brassica cretica TaxID=69181 RepID=A0ABQ7AND9_BRACR|nr:hypothetical protein DY000_02059752 [Brassica cretica]
MKWLRYMGASIEEQTRMHRFGSYPLIDVRDSSVFSFDESTEISARFHRKEPGGWMDYRHGTRRLDGLSSWNPEAGWTIVLEPIGWMDFRPRTRRLVGLSSWNPEAVWTIVLEPGGWMDYCPGTQRLVEILSRNPETLLGPRGVVRIRRFGIRRLTKGLEVVWELGGRFEPGGRFGPEGRFEPGGCSGPGGRLGTQRFLQTLRSYLGPGGTVLRLPRQDYSRYLFGFRILSLGSWPLSSSYAVFYFCRKSLKDLEGAGVGMDVGVGAGASLNREPGGRCPARGLDDISQPDIALVILLSQVLLRSGQCSNLGENKFPGDRPGSSRRFQFSLLGTRHDGETFDASVGINIGLPEPCLNLEESRFHRDRQGSNGYSQVICCPALEQEFLIPDSHCSDKRDLSSRRMTSVAHSHIFPGSEWHMARAWKRIIDLLLAYVPHDWISN